MLLSKNVVPIYTAIYNIWEYHIAYSLSHNRYYALLVGLWKYDGLKNSILYLYFILFYFIEQYSLKPLSIYVLFIFW